MLRAGRWDRLAQPYPDEAGLRARFLPGPVDPPDGEEPRPLWVTARRDPGDPSCQACVGSPTGFCAEHPELYQLDLRRTVR
jgi:hypothetical protein